MVCKRHSRLIVLARVPPCKGKEVLFPLIVIIYEKGYLLLGLSISEKITAGELVSSLALLLPKGGIEPPHCKTATDLKPAPYITEDLYSKGKYLTLRNVKCITVKSYQ